MRRTVGALIVVAASSIAVAGAFVWFGGSEIDPMPMQGTTAKSIERVPTASRASTPTLYCEFTNFADQTPLVGFLFRIEGAPTAPVYALISQREQDGSRAEFGSEGTPSPRWAFDGSDSPTVIRAPEDGTRINLYDYDSEKPGTYWFEAGLRSIRYKNLGGRCRRSM
ncbi:hypothetical protein Q8W71_28930 [Methylobacterium sp. NEAU 140]|uniref:hypothetical protein n=1 Tax=Methylobacterium sp. NEAU 140 TaxID=3064945 RepID=UPI002732FAC4|nr:hypothetical protein [Methylobacterium sp. NEAU 140]MDP4026637.1 hypothetical protein [Methylobacterium sp. NEAU 140]